MRDLNSVTAGVMDRRFLGLYNALNGLGAGGRVDATTGANANTALHITSAVTAFFSGYVPIVAIDVR